MHGTTKADRIRCALECDAGDYQNDPIVDLGPASVILIEHRDHLAEAAAAAIPGTLDGPDDLPDDVIDAVEAAVEGFPPMLQSALADLSHVSLERLLDATEAMAEYDLAADAEILASFLFVASRLARMEQHECMELASCG